MDRIARRSFWGWGLEDGGLGPEMVSMVGAVLASRFPGSEVASCVPPRIEDVRMPPPRRGPPSSIGHLCETDPHARASHTYGKSFRDVVRGLAGDFSPAPDFVARPRTEQDVVRVLAACAEAGIVVIPFGGGSSVVGGVEARGLRDRPGVCSLDLGALDRVLEVDPVSRAARIEAGVLGPSLAAQLRPHGLSLRHYPQSYEFSSLGGWIATRAGGHYATVHTHIDAFVESVRVVTPAGVLETRRLPGSGAGPSPDALFLGSEGALGVITEAWMRLQPRPRFRAGFTAHFDDFLAGARAARALAQSGLHPANCRLIDAREAQNNAIGDGSHHLLIVAFEGADTLAPGLGIAAADLVRSAGGSVREGAGAVKTMGEAEGEGEAGAWRQMFLQGPYLRDTIACLGYVAETFETAVTWDRFEAFHAAVTEACLRAAREVCGDGMVTCRFTHVYPDGPAPYYTVLAPGRGADRVKQWDAIKCAVSEALHAAGGTITHHHAVGRDHRPWYDRERPALYGEVLRAAKRTLDPTGILNPGVLVDP